ncbi:MAG: SH3 domain-containing protein [Wolinella succinogenes]|uniref:SH3 domain-containing protein n=1 Tax=Wolinella succinogenes TaxID=844 RepID=UPI001694DA2F|nr:SH3 domain-containing protein [Wolinella succinogenes]NLU33373.1 SH3 domain-containing protein [Wolinella succinogenes]
MLKPLFFALSLLVGVIGWAEEPMLFPTQPPSALSPSESPSTPKSEEVEPSEPPLVFQRPKSVYLNMMDFPTRTLYQREIVHATYRLLVLANLQSLKTDFLGGDGSVGVLNPNSPWKKEADGSFSNTFYFKIQAQSFTIPKIRVSAEVNGYTDSDESEGRSGKAIVLDRNALFSKVIAKELRITDYKITSYDNENNLAVFRIEAENSNLEDFSLPYYKKQGVESSSFSPQLSSMIYYVILPKSEESIEFDYFASSDYQYRRLSLPNIAVDEKVSTQSDIKPKNNLRIFELSLLGMGILLFVGLYLYRRHILFLLIAFALLGYGIYSLSAKDEGYLKPEAEVRILPTYNSTVILRPESRLKIEILSEHNGYFKIISEDEKIGWVRKEEVEKN